MMGPRTVSLVLGFLLAALPSLPSALPMTDYSQLNHDEPTHWTKAATTEAPWSTPEANSSSGAEYEEPKLPSNNTDTTQDHFYRYDLMEEIKNVLEERDDDYRSPLPTYKTVLVRKAEEEEYEAAAPTAGEESYDSETPFKEWDRDSEEQERLLEGIVMEGRNGSESRSSEQGRWFVLLLAGNSTIVRLRQKDFAKYLKLNLAARLSLEYDELRVNRVVVAPPRLMVNVSVVPSEELDEDEEQEEAPLHRLAETNATLLELSGEEYHVVRFVSLRSERPVSLEEAAGVVVSEKHADVEKVVYLGVGGACALVLLLSLAVALCRRYAPGERKLRLRWRRLEEPRPPPPEPPQHRPPLTVIYSGSFSEETGGSMPPPPLHRLLASPRVDSKLRMLGCRPAQLLIPRTPVRLAPGLDNPNYQS